MRKIDEQTAWAFMSKTKLGSINTKVSVDNIQGNVKIIRIILFGNVIAERNSGDKYFKIRTCGWSSVTTKSRLNALPNVHIKVIKGVWYLKRDLDDADYFVWEGDTIHVSL